LECKALKPNGVTIKIPRPLYQKIHRLIEGSGFSSLSDFIVYVLRDLVGRRGLQAHGHELSAEEVRAMRSRLRNLGYLD